jgi:hypothetical protein
MSQHNSNDTCNFLQTSALELDLNINSRWINNTLLVSRTILPPGRPKDGKIRLALESPTEQFPTPILVMINAKNMVASKKTDLVYRITLLGPITPLLADTLTAAKKDRTLLHHLGTLRHHLDTRVLDLTSPFQTIPPAKKTTMAHLMLAFARRSGPRSDRDRSK